MGCAGTAIHQSDWAPGITRLDRAATDEEEMSECDTDQMRLAKILSCAAIHRDILDGLLDEACQITGETPVNSFTAEAVLDGHMSAIELLASVKAGRYVRL